MNSTEAALREPWANLSRQREAATFGIWVFLGTELLFFGGLFLGYTVYRNAYPEAFMIAARETSIFYGTINTAILMTSSLTMVLAARAGEEGMRRLALWCLAATIALGLGFGLVKGLEYAEDISKGLVPGHDFSLSPPATQLFWTFYWVMTGLHAIHLTVGIGLVSRLLLQTIFGRLPLDKSPAVEVTALYWHLIDVFWIILYPILYLAGRS